MNEDKQLKISIITPSYNQADYIEETIDSVLKQDVPEIEHIVIDGGSSDGTVDILKKYSNIKWISEKDKGQADALNKGFEYVTGEIIGWLNSDDYYEENVFKAICDCFKNPDVMWVVGNLTVLFDKTNEKIIDKSKIVTFKNLIHNADIVRQQPTFFRREFLERVGRWDSGFYMVMDYDLWIRAAKVSTPLMIDKNFAYFRYHEHQKTSLSNIILQKNEITTILMREGISLWGTIPLRIKKRWHWLKASVKLMLISVGLVNSKYQQRPIRVSHKEKS